MTPAEPAVAATASSTPAATKPSFKWEDPLLLDEQLSEDERMVREAASSYCQDKLMPRILEANRHERFDRAMIVRGSLERLVCVMVDVGLVEYIEDRVVHNYFRLDGELNVHAEYGYLVNEATARIVGNWWREHA